MYICLCNDINEKQLQTVLARGARTVEDTFRMLGCKPVCGRCIPIIQQSLDPASARTDAAS